MKNLLLWLTLFLLFLNSEVLLMAEMVKHLGNKVIKRGSMPFSSHLERKQGITVKNECWLKEVVHHIVLRHQAESDTHLYFNYCLELKLISLCQTFFLAELSWKKLWPGRHTHSYIPISRLILVKMINIKPMVWIYQSKISRKENQL